MSIGKPVVQLDSLLKWISCPGKVLFEKKISKKRFDYRSFLRHMVIGTLKFAYSQAAESEKVDLTSHTSGMWTTMMRRYGFPSPEATLRQMNEFYSARSDAFLSISSERMKAINKSHWWELGNNFHPSYFDWRDEVNKYQHLLGFPPIDIVKRYIHEHEYYPATLADCYADYMDAVNVLSKRNYPAKKTKFDVPLKLVLDDVVLQINVDVVFEREKVYNKLSTLAPGTVASSFIFINHFGNPETINNNIKETKDIRYPLIGVEYLDDNGEKVKFIGHEAIILSSGYKNQTWSEIQSPANEKFDSAILEKLNKYAITFHDAEKFGHGVPKLAPNDFYCASCSFLTECFVPGITCTDNFSEKTKEFESEALEVFQEEFESYAEVCDDRIKAMELIARSLDFLKTNNDNATIEAFYHLATNKIDDFKSERNRNAAAKKKI